MKGLWNFKRDEVDVLAIKGGASRIRSDDGKRKNG